MPTFHLPLNRKNYDPDPAGPIRGTLRATVPLEFAITGGVWLTEPRCLLDTGSSDTLVSRSWAESCRVPLPETSSALVVQTAAGSVASRVWDGELLVRFPQLPGRVFRLYCVFSDSYPATAPLLLGLNDFFDTFRVTIDGRPSSHGPFGNMRFECD